MSVTSTLSVVKLKMMPMQELRQILEDEFLNHQFLMTLENLTDDKLSLKIKGGLGKETLLDIERHRHRPLEVEVLVDYGMANSQDLVRKTRPRSGNQGGNRGMMGYRPLWLFLIFGGLILAFISSLAQGFSSLVEEATPGLTPFQRGLLVLTAVALLIASYFTVTPMIRNRQHKAGKEFDLRILKIVETKLELLNDEMDGTTIKRCWNCFREISDNDEFCENCGKAQQ